MIDTSSVVFFVNGAGALALSCQREFAGQEMHPRLRFAVGVFGAVFFWLGFLCYPSAVPR